MTRLRNNVDDDEVFKALADPSRRMVLDELYEQNGRSLNELCENVTFSRQALSKHLHLLEKAGLVVCHFVGRTKLHYLNPAPIQGIAQRWLDKFSRHHLVALAALKTSVEDKTNE